MSFKNLFLNKKEIVILDPNHWVLNDKFVEVVMERLFGMLYCDKVDANVVMGETQTLSALYDELKDNSPRDIIIVLLTLNGNQSYTIRYGISSIIAEKDDVDEFIGYLHASIEAGHGDDDSYEYTASYLRGRIDKEKFHNKRKNVNYH